jgi:mRNA interferase HicA
VTAADLAGSDWELALAHWRERWHVPDRVRLAQADMYIPIDLQDPGHRRMLHDEVARRICILHEDTSSDSRSGWLQSSEGVHDTEIVVPLFPVAPAPQRSRRPAPPRSGGTALHHLPGGNWISAHLYCSLESQQDILINHVAPWVGSMDSLTDKWFFIRYRDEGNGRTHIRLRLHGEPEALSRRVLRDFHGWSQNLVEEGLVSDVSLHTYRPEAERYGGVSLISVAEGFFCADSRLVLDRLNHSYDDLDVAADVIALIQLFHEESSGEWQDWALENFRKIERLHRVFAGRRREAMARIPLAAPNQSATNVEREWAAHLSRYANAIHRERKQENWLDPSDVLQAVVHMHCNRRLEPAADAEATIHAFVRGVAESHVSRLRSKSPRSGN